MSILDQLQRAIRDHELITSEDAVLLVGVSGGVDSLVLLHALAHLRQSLHIEVVAATLDHRLRGDVGAADAAFVEATAKSWGITCERGSVDVAALAPRGTGIEQAARRARYQFFSEVANRLGISRVAVAHHADDQAETVLLHLVRGAGLNGLSGMRWRSPLPGDKSLTLIRPLLGVRRRDIEAYAQENGITPRDDATNQDLTYRRNRVRLEILPVLRKINPDVDTALTRLADSAAEDDAYLNQRLNDLIDGEVVTGEGRVALPKSTFSALPSALQRRYLLWGAQRLKSEIPYSAQELPISHERTMAAVAAALNGQVGTLIELGGGLVLRVDYDCLIMESEVAPASFPFDTPLIESDAVIPLNVPGEADLNGWLLALTPDDPQGSGIPIAIPAGASILIRTRRTGDQFRVRVGEGQIGTRSISRWMIDRKIPRPLRERVPLFIVDSRIAAIIWRGIIVNPDFSPSANDAPDSVVYLKWDIANNRIAM